MKVNFKVDRNGVQNTLIWLISFGLSFVIQGLGWASQGNAFLLIYCVIIGIFMVSTLLRLIPGIEKGMFFIALVSFLFIIGVTFLLTWGASSLLHIGFGVAFELITLGQTMSSSRQN